MTEPEFLSIEDALDHIQRAMDFLRRHPDKGDDHDAVCAMVGALDDIADALAVAREVASRSPTGGKKRPRRWPRKPT
jgi:hypothetical protein